jgi:type III secretion system FlhB-like substrate exporter
MDECDTVALSYQCGQEKAPALMANAINTIELNSSAVS